MAGKFAISEVQQLVESGEIDQEHVHLLRIHVQRVVEVGSVGKRIERVRTRKRGGS